MPRKVYTLTVLGCAMTWFLVGLHLSIVLDLTREDALRRSLPVTLLAVFLVIAIADTWALLRAPAPWGGRSASTPPAA